MIFAHLRGLSSDMKRDLVFFYVQNKVSLRVFDPRSRYIGNGTHVHQPKLQLDALLVPIVFPALMKQSRHTIVAVTDQGNPTENRKNEANQCLGFSAVYFSAKNSERRMAFFVVCGIVAIIAKYQA